MDFHSVVESFAEAWVVANTHTPLTEAAEQGLINGPNNNYNSSNQNQINHPPQPPVTTIQEINKGTSVIVTESPKISEPQSPTKSIESHPSPMKQSSNDMMPKVQEAHGKSLPVHCIIEQNTCGQYVDLDSYAIVPSESLFSDLVRTALVKLGYSGSQLVGAKGSIHLKKWKPLAFDQITENAEATVADILGDLTTVASLHIRLYSVPDNPQEWQDITVRNAVLELLREMSQIKLAKLCPLSQPMLSNIINNRYLGKIGKEKCQEFGLWYLNYRKQNPEASAPDIVPADRPVDGRLTFHPTKELPIMRDWFHSCRNPSRRTLQTYVEILNQGPVRQQERPKIALATLKNWWKNEKQRERKQHSEDKNPDAVRPKRKKKSESSQKEGDPDGNLQPIVTTTASETPPTTSNNFTLINHSESDSDMERFSRRDSELSDGSVVSDSNVHYQKSPALEMPKPVPPKFSFLTPPHPDAGMERFIRKGGELGENPMNGQPPEHGKPAMPVESPYFHKIHSMCIDPTGHNVFSFSDPHLSIHHSSKVFHENSSRTSVIDNNNSHMSSEEDVDVGI